MNDSTLPANVISVNVIRMGNSTPWACKGPGPDRATGLSWTLNMHCTTGLGRRHGRA